MPWSNQGGGPWGSGGSKGPWGSGPQSSGPTPPDLEELLRRSQDKLRSVLPGGNLGGRGFALIALGAVVLWGVSGFFRVEPDELGVVLRFGKEVREVQPGLNYHLPYPIETVLTPKALQVSKIDVGMRIVDDLRRGTTVRDVPEESLMLTGDENIVDVDFSVLWRIKPNGVGEYLFNIQNPGRHGEGGGRKRHARGDRPLGNSADPDRRAAEHRGRGAGTDAEDARPIRRRHPGAAGADAEGRSAAAGHRLLPRRAGGARRPRARAERGADLRQPRGAGGARQGGADLPGRRSLQVADRRRGHRPDLAVHENLRRIQEGARRDAQAHVSGNHGARARRHRQDHSRFRYAVRDRRRALSAAQRTDAAARRPEARDEIRYRRRRRPRPRSRRGRARLLVAVHRLPDATGAGGAARPAGAGGDRARPATSRCR